MSDSLTTDTSKMVLLEEHENRYWTEHLGVTREEVQRAIEKAGHSSDLDQSPALK